MVCHVSIWRTLQNHFLKQRDYIIKLMSRVIAATASFFLSFFFLLCLNIFRHFLRVDCLADRGIFFGVLETFSIIYLHATEVIYTWLVWRLWSPPSTRWTAAPKQSEQWFMFSYTITPGMRALQQFSRRILADCSTSRRRAAVQHAGRLPGLPAQFGSGPDVKQTELRPTAADKTWQSKKK